MWTLRKRLVANNTIKYWEWLQEDDDWDIIFSFSCLFRDWKDATQYLFELSKKSRNLWSEDGEMLLWPIITFIVERAPDFSMLRLEERYIFYEWAEWVRLLYEFLPDEMEDEIEAIEEKFETESIGNWIRGYRR